MAHDEAYISDVFPHGGPLGNMRAEIELYNPSDKSGDASLDARVLAVAPPKADIKSTGQILSLTPESQRDDDARERAPEAPRALVAGHTALYSRS